MSAPDSTTGGAGSTGASGTADKQLVQKPSRGNTGIWVVVGVIIIVLILVIVAFAAGWIGKSTTSATKTPPPTSCVVPSGQTLLAAGSTFIYPLMDVWTTEYTASTITYSSVGSGTGITDLAQKTVDFAASDAPLSPAQQVTDPNAIEMPESAGAVAIIYNVPGVPTLKFTGAVLAAIYLGDITNWNASQMQSLNPGVTLPNQAINVVHRSDGSGTSFAFTSYLSKENTTWASTVGYATSVTWPVGTGEKGSGGVTDYVQDTPYTIGYVDLEYALSVGIAFGAVENPAGYYVEPSLASAASALADHTAALPPAGDAKDWYNVSILNEPGNTDYPISTMTYLMSYQNLSVSFGSSFTSAQADAMLSFWNWTIHAGQSYSASYYYVPLPANIVAADEAELAAFTYNNAAVAHC